MANIGTLALNDNGALVGKVETLNLNMTIGLRPYESTNPNAPRYEILALTKARTWLKVGALFEHASRRTGEAFLQGKIDDPSMEKPLYITCHRQEDGTYNIAWSRPRPRREELGSGDLQGAADDRAADDGLGDSTAPNSADGLPPLDAAQTPARGRGRKASEPTGE